MGSLVLPVHRDLLASVAWPACLVFLDQRVTEVSLAWMGQREHLVVLERKERMVPLDLLELLAQWVLLAPEAREEGTGQMDHLASEA